VADLFIGTCVFPQFEQDKAYGSGCGFVRARRLADMHKDIYAWILIFGVLF